MNINGIPQANRPETVGNAESVGGGLAVLDGSGMTPEEYAAMRERLAAEGHEVLVVAEPPGLRRLDLHALVAMAACCIPSHVITGDHTPHLGKRARCISIEPPTSRQKPPQTEVVVARRGGRRIDALAERRRLKARD